MLALGTVRNLVVDMVKSGKVQFDVSTFLQSVVLTDMNLTGIMWKYFSLLYLMYIKSRDRVLCLTSFKN